MENEEDVVKNHPTIEVKTQNDYEALDALFQVGSNRDSSPIYSPTPPLSPGNHKQVLSEEKPFNFPGNPIVWIQNNFDQVTVKHVSLLRPMEYVILEEKMSWEKFSQLPRPKKDKSFWSEVDRVKYERRTSKDSNYNKQAAAQKHNDVARFTDEENELYLHLSELGDLNKPPYNKAGSKTEVLEIYRKLQPGKGKTVKHAQERLEKNKGVNARERGKQNKWKKTDGERKPATSSFPKQTQRDRDEFRSHDSASDSYDGTRVTEPPALKDQSMHKLFKWKKFPYLEKLFRLNIWIKSDIGFFVLIEFYDNILLYEGNDIYTYIYDHLLKYRFINQEDPTDLTSTMSMYWLLDQPRPWIESIVRANKSKNFQHHKLLIKKKVEPVPALKAEIEKPVIIEQGLVVEEKPPVLVPALDPPPLLAVPPLLPLPAVVVPPIPQVPPVAPLEQHVDGAFVGKPMILNGPRKVWAKPPPPPPMIDPFDMLLETPNAMFMNDYHWLQNIDGWFPTEHMMTLDHLIASPEADARSDNHVNTIMLHTDPLSALYYYHSRTRLNIGLFSLPLSFMRNNGPLLVNREVAMQVINNNGFSVDDDPEIAIQKIRSATGITGTVNYNKTYSLSTRNQQRDTAFFCANMWHLMQHSVHYQPFLDQIRRVGLPAGGLSDTILMKYCYHLIQPLMKISKYCIKTFGLDWIVRSCVFPLVSTFLVLPIATLTLLTPPLLSMAQSTELVGRIGKGSIQFFFQSSSLLLLDGCVKTLPLLTLYWITVSKVGLNNQITRLFGKENWKKLIIHGVLLCLVYFGLRTLRSPCYHLLKMNLTPLSNILALSTPDQTFLKYTLLPYSLILSGFLISSYILSKIFR